MTRYSATILAPSGQISLLDSAVTINTVSRAGSTTTTIATRSSNAPLFHASSPHVHPSTAKGGCGCGCGGC